MEISLESLIAKSLSSNNRRLRKKAKRKLINIINAQIEHKFTDAFSSMSFSILCKILKNISEYKFNNLLIYNVDLSNIVFKECEFSNTEFYNCDFTNTVFINCKINKITDCNIKNTYFDDCKINLINNLDKFDKYLKYIINSNSRKNNYMELLDLNTGIYYKFNYKFHNMDISNLFVANNVLYGFINDLLIRINNNNGVYDTYDAIVKINNTEIDYIYDILVIDKNKFIIEALYDEFILIDVENLQYYRLELDIFSNYFNVDVIYANNTDLYYALINSNYFNSSINLYRYNYITKKLIKIQEYKSNKYILSTNTKTNGFGKLLVCLDKKSNHKKAWLLFNLINEQLVEISETRDNNDSFNDIYINDYNRLLINFTNGKIRLII